ncbi:S-adenosylmethionine:tRNA ribosyltransferase-isomerase [Actinocrinis sp.]|uniref:S-adenosylmethionine:tRNA ribosyltransferase-isomerase n=1 Tax=Actinocrinis sp. TaxID=1920516 RepID=UPI002D56DCAD|nr:S-adenosylmethionine:tRNA ribosyltransferase-isomerase [Actinocrinis sp.]HZP54040.1 S-adenosylmethionine:tRNA ribosyltransferase-isomerase [Actinocrinis sp.]
MMLIRDVAQLGELRAGSGAGRRGSAESGFDENGGFPGLDAFETGFDFTVPEELSARAPAEARGLRRDAVRMLVGHREGLELSHHTAADLPRVLRPGDLLVVNNSGTLPAALNGRLPDGTPVAVHVSSAEPGAGGEYLVELRRPHAGSTVPYAQAGRHAGRTAGKTVLTVPSPARPGLEIALPEGASFLLTAAFTKRLWYAHFRLPSRGGEPSGTANSAAVSPLTAFLSRHGKPIRYSYVDRDWPLSAYQTVFAAEPGSSEMPSAARPFTLELVAALVSRGVLIAPITLHTGVASPEAHEAPYAERYRVPQSTARLVNHVRAHGGRVIAVGTTAVRALESAADLDGKVHAADGWTDLIITPERGVRAVDGLLTGWHEPRASHLLMLEAVAGRPLLDLCYAEAIRERYLWHEFGDVNLLLR